MKDLLNKELLEQHIAILETELEEAMEELNKQEIARLERKEKIEQEIARLEQLISRKDDEFDKEQGKRIKRTFFALCGVIYFLLFCLALKDDEKNIIETVNGISNMDAENIFYLLVCLTVGVAIFAGLIMFMSFGIMSYTMNGALKRAETIAKLEGELSAIKFSKYNKE